MTNARKGFREDINGLRAWAVISVVFYHFGIVGFSGGFVGVDIFFVISGFLMVGIIVNALEKSSREDGVEPAKFVVNFYLSRAWRIIPALLVLCAVLLVLGWFFLSATEYKALGTHAISALSFFSNVKFWREAGYFAAASHDKLLLHTWSLSVEWQFYVILPLVLIAIWKLRPSRTPIVITLALCLLSSLLLSIVLSPVKPTAAFFLLPTRAWEMLAGGLVFLLANSLRYSPRLQKIIEGSGFVLIIASIILFDTSSNWPGWRALVPVIGTVLVLIAARQSSLWTGSRIAQWLGDCSYSLYLWHWPFAVALVYLQLQDHPGAIALCLFLTLLFGRLSYSLIETSARASLSRMPRWAGASALLTGILVVALPSLLVRSQEGVPGRLSAEVEAVFNEAENKNPRMKECFVGDKLPTPECTYGGDKLGVIVVGDSHAGSVVRSVEKALPDLSLNVLDWTMHNCPTILKIRQEGSSNYRCNEFLSEVIIKHNALPVNVPVVIINRTSMYVNGPNEPDRVGQVDKPIFYVGSSKEARTDEFFRDMRSGLVETACEFAKVRPVYIVRPIPELKINVPKTMGRAMIIGDKVEVSISIEEYRKRNAFVWGAQDEMAARCGVKILDPLPYLCINGRCKGDVNGLPIYYDDDHLNERGGSLLIPMFRQVFNETGTPINVIGKREMPEAKAFEASAVH